MGMMMRVMVMMLLKGYGNCDGDDNGDDDDGG